MDTVMSQFMDTTGTETQASSTMWSENDPQSSSSSLATASQSPIVSNHILVEDIGRSTLGRSMQDFTWFYKNFFQKRFGKVIDVYVAKDHESWQPANAAIITFKNSESAQKALNASEEWLLVDLQSIKLKCCYHGWMRVLKVSPIEETLISKVRRFVKTRQENSDSEMKEIEDEVTKLISGEIKRGPFLDHQEPNSVQSGIQKLPNDVIWKIIQENDDMKELASCELVCRRWNSIAQDIWSAKKELHIEHSYGHSYGFSFNEDLFSILKRCPNLRDLKIEYQVDKLTLQIIGECCPFLEKLVSFNLQKISPKLLAKFCPRLKDFDFTFGFDLTEGELGEFIREFNYMESLEVYGDGEILGESFQCLSRLRTLDVMKGQITSKGYANLALGCHSSLKELYANGITGDNLSVICESFKNLRKLSISSLHEEIFDLVSKVESLEDLYIGENDPYDRFEGIFDEEKFLTFIQSCRKLKVLRLPGRSDFTDNAICQLPKYCQNLKRLEIASKKITCQGYDALSQLNSLENLTISEVNDDGIKRVLMGCPELVYLEFRGCSNTIQTLLTAFDLKSKNLINSRLTISYHWERVKISDLKNQQQIHDLNRRVQEELSDPESFRILPWIV